MIKSLSLLTRRPELSHAEFVKHWLEIHGPLALAVPAYAIALLAMAAMAQVARRGQPFVAAGAFAFVASDALLGLALFRHLSGGAPLIWPLYVVAQGSIALGWLYGRELPSASAEVAP